MPRMFSREATTVSNDFLSEIQSDEAFERVCFTEEDASSRNLKRREFIYRSESKARRVSRTVRPGTTSECPHVPGNRRASGSAASSLSPISHAAFLIDRPGPVIKYGPSHAPALFPETAQAPSCHRKANDQPEISSPGGAFTQSSRAFENGESA